MKHIMIMLLFTGNLAYANAQVDSVKTKPKVVFSAYMEIYYSYDFANPADKIKPGFIYSYNRSNQINVNLVYGKLNYTTDIFRVNAAIMAGTYSVTNLAPEPGLVKNIFEANIGFKLTKKKNVWLDLGVFPSHIGFESAVGKDCWTLTRSILADNSPYYESGARLTYTSSNEKLTVAALVLNGWQRIAPVKGNTLPSFGWQLTYVPNAKFTINSSSFIGPMNADTSRQMRYFHNLYATYQPITQFGLTAGFDVGIQQNAKGSSVYNPWYSPVLILRYTPIEKLGLALRYEYYSDANGVIFNTGTPNGFKTQGVSLNLDYWLHKNIMWRAEAKMYHSADEIFELRNKPSNQNYSVTTVLIFAF
jgi:hypothetical protein